jgi:hypothetical protein
MTHWHVPWQREGLLLASAEASGEGSGRSKRVIGVLSAVQKLADPATAPAQARRLVTVALPGEIDFTNAGEVRAALDLALESGGAVVIADAAETTFATAPGSGR